MCESVTRELNIAFKMRPRSVQVVGKLCGSSTAPFVTLHSKTRNLSDNHVLTKIGNKLKRYRRQGSATSQDLLVIQTKPLKALSRRGRVKQEHNWTVDET